MKNKNLKYYILFSLIYFGQGIYSLPAQAVGRWLKNLQIPYGTIETIGAWIIIPWVIKPLYGLISDFFPLFGYRRKSYLIINYIFLVLAGIYVYIFGFTVPSYILISICCGFCFAFNDVCGDAIMVKQGQEAKMTGEFSSVQWGSIWAASAIVGLLGGVFSHYNNYKLPYLIGSLFILGILIYIIKFYKEKKYIEKVNVKAWSGIKKALKNKQLLITAVFLFCLWFTPSFGSIFTNSIMRDKLHFSEILIGVLGTTGTAFGILGAIIYYKLCKKINLKKLLTFTIIFGGLTTFCYLYYPNIYIAFLYAVLFGVFGGISHLVVIDYVAKITPKESEAFIFSGMCSVLNLGAMCSRFAGGSLYPIVGLNGLIIIGGIFTLLCIFFIPALKIGEEV